MHSSGLIVAFVVALWAAYFVPLVLRRYDESSKHSGLDAEGPMRRVVTASRKPKSPTAEEAGDMTTSTKPTAASTSSPSVDDVQPVAMQRPDTQSAARTRPDRPSAAAIAARRRRRTLLTLTGVLALVVGLIVSSILPVWSVAAPALLIVAWLVACRVQVRHERGISRPHGSTGAGAKHSFLSRIPMPSGKAIRARLSAPGSSKDRAPKRTSPSPQPGRPASRRVEATVPFTAEEEDTVIVDVNDDPAHEHVMEQAQLTSSDLEEHLQIAVPSSSVTGEALWDPLPVTVPTYVNKPRVGRTVRTIDFSQGGAWTSGHVEGEDTDYPVARRSDEGHQPRAVGH